MLRRGQRWQYPAKTQPVQEVALPTLDWLVEHPDPVRRPPELVGEQFAFTRLVELSEIPIDWLVQHPDPLPNPPRDVAVAAAGEASTQQPGFPIPPTSYASPTSIVFDAGVVQIQARAEPVFAEAPPAVPDIGWLVQHPDPVRPPLRLVPGEQFFTRLVELSEITIDWLVQQPDPVRRPPAIVPEGRFVHRDEHEDLIPAIDWLVQHPDPVRRPPELVGEGYGFTRLVELSEIPIDWLVEPAIVTRPPERLVPGEQVFLRLVELSEIPIGWLVQHPDPILPLPRPPTEAVLVEFGIPIPPVIPDIDFIVQHPVPPLPLPLPQQPDSFVFGPVPIIPAFDWFVQETDIIRRVPPIQTQPELAFEHEDLIPAPDWLVQHPDPVRPPERLVPEAFAFEFEHELLIPSIDWLQQLPDPIQELRRPPTEPVAPELAEVPPPPVVFSWWQQLPDPIQPEERRQDWYALGEVPVEIPIETWLQPPSQPVQPLPPRQDYYARDLTIPEVLLNQWWQPASQPVRLPIQLVRFHGELFLIEFAVPPGVPIPFVFRECQALWQIVHPEFWESAVLPSGYVQPVEYVPPPSGYIEPAEPSPVPSGYIAEEGGTAPWDMVR